MRHETDESEWIWEKGKKVSAERSCRIPGVVSLLSSQTSTLGTDEMLGI